MVDLREESPTYLQWTCAELTADNLVQMYVPPRCGHGFLSMAGGCTVLYGQEGTYAPQSELNLRWSCPTLGLRLPGSVADASRPGTGTAPRVISDKDANAPSLLDLQPGAVSRGSKRALIVGASGQVGTALAALFGSAGCAAGRHSVVGTFNRVRNGAGQIPFDLEVAATDLASCRELMYAAGFPDVVVIAGAFCWVDGCENQRNKADAVNSAGAGNVAAAATAIGAKVVYFGTDYVFDGTAGPYDEDAAASPLNHYGASKLRGEALVRAAAPGALVLRTTGVYGHDPQTKNFVCQLISKIRAGTEMYVPIDQVNTPTYTGDIAEATALLLAGGHAGVFNVVGSELLDRHAFAAEICRVLGLDAGGVLESVTEDLGQGARRPLQGGLTLSKLRATLPGFEPRTVEAALLDWAPLQTDFKPGL